MYSYVIRYKNHAKVSINYSLHLNFVLINRICNCLKNEWVLILLIEHARCVGVKYHFYFSCHMNELLFRNHIVAKSLPTPRWIFTIAYWRCSSMRHCIGFLLVSLNFHCYSFADEPSLHLCQMHPMHLHLKCDHLG